MSISGDVFEPCIVRKMLKNLAGTLAEKRQFESNWKANVDKRLKGWLNHQDKQSRSRHQLEWEAEIVEYVDYLHQRTSLHKNSKAPVAPSLGTDIPLLGPRFFPPTYLHFMRRIIHLVFYPSALDGCPACGSNETLWDGWTATGAHEVMEFGEKSAHLDISSAARSARPNMGKAAQSRVMSQTHQGTASQQLVVYSGKSGSTGEYQSNYDHHQCQLVLQNNSSIKLHLLEYYERKLEYLSCFEAAHLHPFPGQRTNLEMFSEPGQESGYSDAFITNDLITDIYLDFIKKTREGESHNYCQTRTGKCLSLDNTFRSAKKAVILEKDKTHTKMFKGGILSVINERSETLAWSASPEETRVVLEGIKKRHDVLQVPQPNTVVVDNCCQVRWHVSGGLPGSDVVLDVHHFMSRYGSVLINGARNPYRSQVLLDIRNSIIKQPAGKNGPAKYWEKDEQEERLEHAFEKWLKHGNIWLTQASKVHTDQLAHVKKGCLARRCQDIASDGSRIEGSHKAWNLLQRAQPSGLEVYAGLAHDFVLRQNLRIGSTRLKNAKNLTTADQFALSAHESHHISLVDFAAHLFNSLYQKEPLPSKQKLRLSPTLPRVASGETFGLVVSENTTSFGRLFVVKDEPELDPDLQILDEMLSDRDGDGDGDGSIVVMGSGPPTSSKGKRKADADHVTVEGEGGSVTGAAESPPAAKRLRQVDGSEKAEAMSLSLLSIMDISSTEEQAIHDHAITAPAPQSQRSEVDMFFRPVLTKNQTEQSLGPLVNMTGNQVHAKETLDSLTAPLSKPPAQSNLTRSQLLFSVATSINPLSLSIKGKSEFFLFMDMRAEFQWVTFSMTSQKWVSATQLFNSCLETQGKVNREAVVKKNPRALMEKLGEVEAIIVKHVATKNYTSQRSGTEIFWQKHCTTVQAVIKSEGVDANVNAGPAIRKRKVAICSRCKAVMYPGPTGAPENHRKGICADGVRQKAKADTTDQSLPEWPQPIGIFTDGVQFHLLKFLSTVRELYDKVFEDATSSCGQEFSMEDEAFAMMLNSRIQFVNGRALFCLFDLVNMPGTPESLLIR
ncbi:unnamed protein product [Cyclocybe aegerita]|uniref:Uncharacterized protein n=1 Tax=Cyclocybe aegerita TaxID=1973307 RepID=A0A8S0W4B6_CYCAE|nr:unnamed protein product [Cyclocybe aegerita]